MPTGSAGLQPRSSSGRTLERRRLPERRATSASSASGKRKPRRSHASCCHAEPVVLFGIRGPGVIRLDAAVAIEPKAISPQNAAAVGAVLLNPVLGCLFHEATQRLSGDITLIGGVIFLRDRKHRYRYGAKRKGYE